jgi:hypothetical protein
MDSRREVIRLGLAWLAVELVRSPMARAQTAGARPGSSGVSLRDQLARGLRARRPVEFQFVDQVVALVEQGVLPLTMVQTTYLWARRKSTYPFAYFMVALTRRARAIGIQLNSDIGG